MWHFYPILHLVFFFVNRICRSYVWADTVHAGGQSHAAGQISGHWRTGDMRLRVVKTKYQRRSVKISSHCPINSRSAEAKLSPIKKKAPNALLFFSSLANEAQSEPMRRSLSQWGAVWANEAQSEPTRHSLSQWGAVWASFSSEKPRRHGQRSRPISSGKRKKLSSSSIKSPRLA